MGDDLTASGGQGWASRFLLIIVLIKNVSIQERLSLKGPKGYDKEVN